MYYILNAANQPEGPYPAEWIRANARAETLVSRGQTWIKYAIHPDFSLMSMPPPPPPPRPGFGPCTHCGGQLRPALRHCIKCGRSVPYVPPAVPASEQLAFQHPLDIGAIRILSATPGLDLLAKFLSGAVIERLMNIELVGHSARVDDVQYPRIYHLYLMAAQRLNIGRLPDLYVKQGGDNAYSVGIEKYYIVVETGLLELVNEEELMAVLAHELGHVKCDHMKYLTMVSLLRQFGQMMLDMISLPLAPALLMGVQAALLQWYQKSELSADRAALLVTRDVAVVERMLSKFAGYSPKYCDSLDVDRLKQQADRFDEIGTGSLVEKALKVWTLLQLTHPVPVLRIREIGEWARTPEYERMAVVVDDDAPARACARCEFREHDASAVFCGYCGLAMP